MVRACARNNAEWCDIVCRSHDVMGRFYDDAWVSPHRTPPNYPDAVTLRPGTDAASIVGRIDPVAAECSVKDSFSDLDLSGAGFQILFDAEWIHRSDGTPVLREPTLRWSRVRDSTTLTAWERAWGAGADPERVFRPILLSEPQVEILAGCAGDRLVAGAILNRTGSLVGVSNLFTSSVDLADVWAACLEVAQRDFPGAALAGYESGETLLAARRAGFRSAGPLRVWFKARPDGVKDA